MTFRTSPFVSVLMPARNVAPYIREAVLSILGQTFSDFEFLIVDDASEDGTWRLLEELAARDSRIRLLRNEQPKGLPENVNHLVDISRGQYIARMDADDIAVPDRFARQVALLDSGEADFCGGGFVEFPSGRPGIHNGPELDADIKVSLLFETTIRHPTVMMKRELLVQEKFLTEAIPVADYDLWIRLANIARFRNLPEVLLLWRVHGGQVTAQSREANLRASMRVRRQALEGHGITPTQRELALHSEIWTTSRPRSWQDVLDTEAWLVKLARALQDTPGAARHLSHRWYKFCLKSAPYGLRTFRLFRRSKLFDLHPYSRGESKAVALMCLLRIGYQSKLYWFLYAFQPSARRQRQRIRELPPDLLSIIRD